VGSSLSVNQVAQQPSIRALNADASTAGMPGRSKSGGVESLEVFSHGLQLGVAELGDLFREPGVDQGSLAEGLDSG
jgi:hypothetical protein